MPNNIPKPFMFPAVNRFQYAHSFIVTHVDRYLALFPLLLVLFRSHPIRHSEHFALPISTALLQSILTLSAASDNTIN